MSDGVQGIADLIRMIEGRLRRQKEAFDATMRQLEDARTVRDRLAADAEREKPKGK